MGIALNTNFDYKGPLPLDERISFNSVEEMQAYGKSNLYEGIVCHIKGTRSYYEYTKDEAGLLDWRDHIPVVEELNETEVQDIINSLI